MKGFYMAIGTSGNQYKNAPVVGAMMAELIDACEKKALIMTKNPFNSPCVISGERSMSVSFLAIVKSITTAVFR